MSAKILIITGGSKGIGKACVQRFQQAGYRVINISRSVCDVPQVENLALDMSEPGWAERGASVLHDAITRVAPAGEVNIVLVHNAARLDKDSATEIDAGAFAGVLQVNVIAPAQLNQIVLPVMARGSAIVYLGSTLSEKAVAGACSYVTSKHAVVGLMRATCQDLAGRGIHTNCVCPGFTNTEMLRAHVGNDAGILAAIASGVTDGRLIEPAEIAEVVFAAATQPVLNGALLHANLGQIER